MKKPKEETATFHIQLRKNGLRYKNKTTFESLEIFPKQLAIQNLNTSAKAKLEVNLPNHDSILTRVENFNTNSEK